MIILYGAFKILSLPKRGKGALAHEDHDNVVMDHQIIIIVAITIIIIVSNNIVMMIDNIVMMMIAILGVSGVGGWSKWPVTSAKSFHKINHSCCK